MAGRLRLLHGLLVMSLVPLAYEMPLFGMVCLVYVAAVTILSIKAPVKLIKPKGGTATIRFRNDTYAHAFQKLNG